jgi:pilus assembly protein FimV
MVPNEGDSPHFVEPERHIMSRRLNRFWLLLAFLISGELWALGLGDITLDSALNQPLRAEIELISATPDELSGLTITIASAETFARYGIDRPLFLSRLKFDIIPSGRTDDNIIRITSADPVTEPFVTFLVEAVWPRGRLLREYTLLLDPPTFASPATTQAPQAVTAPTSVAPTDSGRITRVAPVPEPAPREAPPRTRAPQQAPTIESPRVEPSPREPAQPQQAPEPTLSDATRYDDGPVGVFSVQRGDTLWGIANRVRQGSRLTINQTMLAIYEANPQAFAGNINVLSAGASLRIPSADEVFNISRGDALSEVQRQHNEWGGTAGITTSYSEPSLTLLPPDDDTLTTDSGSPYDAGDLQTTQDTGQSAEDARIQDIEQLLADHQDSLIEIGDNELAALRVELAQLRGEELPLEPVVEDPAPLVDEVPDVADPIVDDVEDPVTEPPADDSVADESPAPRVVLPPAQSESGLIDSIIEAVTGIWGLIGGALVVVAGVLIWFAKRAARGGDDDSPVVDDDSTGVWESLGAEDHDDETFESTARLRALAQEDESSIVVVEQEMAQTRDDLSASAPPVVTEDILAETGTNRSLEDTFSSETAINLDQSDPIAEADFHMAYGLYDQAADLINGVLTVDPGRQDLLTKLCEIYFVWGNRDAFVDAATRLNNALSGNEDSEWDKIVIMGQQIAGDHELFSDVTPGAATKAVDMSFDGAVDETNALDIDFAYGSESADEGTAFIDLGEDDDTPTEGADGIDFEFDDQDTSASVTQEMPPAVVDETVEESTIPADQFEKTIESAAVDASGSDETVATPTVEQQFDAPESTAEMPSLDATVEMSLLGDADATEIATLDDVSRNDETAEIDLADLGLDLGSLTDSAVPDLLGTDSEELSDLDDTAERQTLKIDESLAATSEMPSIDEITGRNLVLPEEAGDDLLEATGQTQVLPEGFAVETGTGTDIQAMLADEDATMLAPNSGERDDILMSDAETMLAPLDDDDVSDENFDYAKTEALPDDAFVGDMTADKTAEMPEPAAAGSTDMDLDLDDLTAALEIGGVGDVAEDILQEGAAGQQQPDATTSLDLEDNSPTSAMAPENLSGDLHNVRTMTEVGTKLDLARAYVDMGDPSGARSILEEVLDEGDEAQRQQAKQLLDSLPS